MKFMEEIPDLIQNVHKWKAVRQLASPTMTGAKIKSMSGAMLESVKIFTDNLKLQIDEKSAEGNENENIDIKWKIDSLIFDLITRSFFGISPEDPGSPTKENFVKMINKVVQGEPDSNGNWEESSGGYIESFKIFQAAALTFPILNKFATTFTNVANDVLDALRDILTERANSGRNRADYLECILTWMDRLDSPEFKKLGITYDTIMAQPTLVYFSANDQVSTILTRLFYNVAKNEEIERKIYQELDTFLEKYNGQILFENIKELTYLMACVTESLRLYPFFTRLERVCTKDWVDKESGLFIKKGMTIIVPIYAANRNPIHFPDPEKFDPERFTPANRGKIHPYALLSYGHGPRNCFGQRFGNEVMLLIAAVIFKEFKLRLVAGQEEVKYSPASLISAYSDTIYFWISKRE